MAKHIYRHAKSSWGIWIELDCTAYSLDDFESEYVSVTDYLHFATSPAKTNYGKVRNASFREGLLLIADTFAEAIRQPTVIQVHEANYNWTDFQAEGYGYGIANWVIQEFKLNITLPLPDYDKEANRYIFPYTIDDSIS